MTDWIVAICAILTLVAPAFVFLLRAFKQNIVANVKQSAAIEGLTGVLHEMKTQFGTKLEEHDEKLQEHDVKLGVIETRLDYHEKREE